MKALNSLLSLMGGLGVFLLGIEIISEGLQKTAGPRLRRILPLAAGNRVAAIFSGFSITALLQSSSAAAVMAVGFASAGLLTLTRSLGLICGAEYGAPGSAAA
ncbi:MAG: hypothetical protein COX65_07745 [Elusimicrobia bacterium CG_4_10_14_0_2_um_filter_56_8]|nr:MAG: hypothetical protein AUJ51_12055 [Elusimicrobia bacterium CG1_02_56_21]PJA12994.1 MAG: hypothetical protein COX65_07745 [Elusimicrobia bacterium CG_4_10_14_0_2_um_filter_56_8]